MYELLDWNGRVALVMFVLADAANKRFLLALLVNAKPAERLTGVVCQCAKAIIDPAKLHQ